MEVISIWKWLIILFIIFNVGRQHKNHVNAMEFVNVALLVSPRHYVNDEAIQNSEDLVNKNILRPSGTGLLLSVFKVVIHSHTVLDHDFIFAKNLSHVSFIIEAENTDPLSCLASELLRVPMISLVDRHRRTNCKTVISMRPDDRQLSEAMIDMIREDQPKIVVVLAEDSLDETVGDLMSYNQMGHKFYFRIIATIDMSDPFSIKQAVYDLKESGMKKVLLLFHSANLEIIMKEIRNQGIPVDDFRWYTALTVFPVTTRLSTLDGLMGLEIPVDEEVYERVLNELNGMRQTVPDNYKRPLNIPLNPLLHDALSTIARGFAEYVRIAKIPQLPNFYAANYCPIRRHELQVDLLLEKMKKLFFEGITGDVRFTASGYRRVTELEVNEIQKSQKVTLGMWSSNCRTFRWNHTWVMEKPAEQPSCRKEEQTEEMTTFKPRKIFLRIVTVPEEPFMIFDRKKRGNDRFSGFCKDLIDRLSKELEFTYELYLAPDRNYGAEVNGSWNGMVGQLITKQADVALSSVTITADREGVIDFTKPFMDFTMSLIMKRPTTPELEIFAFLKPFTGELWLSILAVTFAVSALMWIVDRYSPCGYRNTCKENDDIVGNEFNLSNSLWFATSSMLQQGCDYTPKNTSGRILSASFWFFILIIIATYTANLAAFFTMSRIKIKINSLEDLADQSDVKYGIQANGQTYTFFKTTQIPLYHLMYKQLVAMNGFEKGTTSAVDKVRKGSFAYLTEDPVISYVNQKQPCDTMLVQNLLESKSYGLGLQSNSEWTNPLSVKILKLRESGFIESIRLKWWDDRSECVIDLKKAKVKPISLQLRNMAGVYLILLVGAAAAFGLLLYDVRISAWIRLKCSRGIHLKQPQLPANHQSSRYMGYHVNGIDTRSNSNHHNSNHHHHPISRRNEMQSNVQPPFPEHATFPNRSSHHRNHRNEAHDRYPDAFYDNARESTL